jgi:hypothetical protein
VRRPGADGLVSLMMAAASLIREHAREVTGFIIEGNAVAAARNKTDGAAESLSCHLRRGRRNRLNGAAEQGGRACG